MLYAAQDAVAVVGYPIGGETISVTTGVVSRIEVTSYSHGATELLGIQIDAAINPGNSGVTRPRPTVCELVGYKFVPAPFCLKWNSSSVPSSQVKTQPSSLAGLCCTEWEGGLPTGWNGPCRGPLLQ